jgi:hypothetical protein
VTVKAQTEVLIPKIPSAEVKSALRPFVDAAVRSSTDAMSRMLLLGGVCELILFADLPEATLLELRNLHDANLNMDTNTVQGLLGILQGMCE